MGDDTFDIDAELAKKDAEQRAAAFERMKLQNRLAAWNSATGAISHIKLYRLGDSVADAFKQFVSRGGKIKEDRTVWLPPEHPQYGNVVLDESCMKVPQLVQVATRNETSPYAAETRQKEWEDACAKVRARVAAEWDTKFPRPGCLEFVDWDFEGAHKYGWVIFDERAGVAYLFHDHRGSYVPSLEEIRKELVDALYYQTRKGDAAGSADQTE
ncbi:hypothetical protein Achl_4157 (plasmid) [Pseudarthrobacter chlorophenolicus A6]|uniref:Uncharacterized protein n=1 Tax=Pseudarthrobacter chlorophenolicus (strain ATCC 700700 / DSM 12829 / CIP 107037 / JCM 12360 / KCTC 9906 / NCIMB 13794 / A6) TaxID=452863 RepID=B8HI61_PSECP|nr:hypothetical protein [Pseudarthrobacter chlorophenolicus]ACL42108.1 hypothetical protein Achl_4157 [Pseudarthrobacter chlorophenolicus A6]SDQ13533.1 hypothetical protein SAMN04489738_0216 [Pseudarthrobacter chlorophenolicus]